MIAESFPIGRGLSLLSACAWVLGGLAAGTLVAAVLAPSYLLLLLAIAFVLLIPGALALYAVAGAMGRRSLFELSAERRGRRPSDAQMKRYLLDADPWEFFALYTLFAAVIGLVCAAVAAIAIAASGGSPGEFGIAVGLAVCFAAAAGVGLMLRRRSAVRGAADAVRRDRTWPLPADSDLLAVLRSKGGDSGTSGPL